MKNNFRFIFPRLVGATVIVGLAALIITTLFKLLIGLVLIGGVVSLVRRMAGRERAQFGGGRYGQVAEGGVGPFSQYDQWGNHMSVNPVVANKTTIVPIN